MIVQSMLILSSTVAVAIAVTSKLFTVNKICCATLHLNLGSQVIYPGDAAYAESTQSYYAHQERELEPACVVRPTSSANVASVLRTLSLLDKGMIKCPFAVRGGGHSPNPGSANIDGGVTIDMRALATVTVNSAAAEGQTLTSVGAGARWKDVYDLLTPMNLAVAGGRDTTVGVAGLALGGGISYFSPRKGFVCDNVYNYEVVLGNGKTVNANSGENPDLWRALRGGSNNFGIVTRFDFETFSVGQLWGGFIYYDFSTVPQQIEAFYNFAANPDFDERASVFQGYGFGSGQYVAFNSIVYTAPTVNPPVTKSFVDIQPQFINNLRISNHTDFATNTNGIPYVGLFNYFITTTFKLDAPFMSSVIDMYKLATDKTANATNMTSSLLFLPIVPAITSKSAPQGGNSLGLAPSDGPLVVALASLSWTSANDSDFLTSTASMLFAEIDKASTAKGLYSPWKYLNYAAAHQNPIAGYGKQSVEELRATSRNFDPKGLFQNAVPGGFKLFT